MKNLFTNFNSTLCLLQQINLDSDEKYFIFGIKFDDIFIPDNAEIKDNKKVKFFIIEKTYLFISNEPMFKLFENIVNYILVYKKVIFQKLIEFNSLLDKKNVSEFNDLNKENVRKKIFYNYYYYRMMILIKFWIIFIIKNFQNQMNIFLMYVLLKKLLLNIIIQANMIYHFYP